MMIVRGDHAQSPDDDSDWYTALYSNPWRQRHIKFGTCCTGQLAGQVTALLEEAGHWWHFPVCAMWDSKCA